jgi:hypothetical protein
MSKKATLPSSPRGELFGYGAMAVLKMAQCGLPSATLSCYLLDGMKVAFRHRQRQVGTPLYRSMSYEISNFCDFW